MRGAPAARLALAAALGAGALGGCKPAGPKPVVGAVLVVTPGHVRLGNDGLVGLEPEAMASRDAVAATYPSFAVSEALADARDVGAEAAEAADAVISVSRDESGLTLPILTIEVREGVATRIALGAPGIASMHDLQVDESWARFVATSGGAHDCDYTDAEEPWVQCTIGDATHLYYVFWVGRPEHGDPPADARRGAGLDAWMARAPQVISQIVWQPYGPPVVLEAP